MPSRYDLSRDEIAALLDGEPRYRIDQIWHGLFTQLTDPGELSVLPKTLRERVRNTPEFKSGLHPVFESTTDNGDTTKWLYELHDGRRIETVLMHYADRSTVCISSQAGCAMACSFCATGQAGFDRHLTSGEIVEQYVRAQQRGGDRRVSNVVFMGMGEPLANFDRLWAAIEKLHFEIGLGARNITVSTVGVVPGIRKLTAQHLPVNLAVSLHAANDELRSSLVPLNDRYPLPVLIEACEEYYAAKNRRVSFEWALIDGTNDRESDADELAAIALPLGAHVNVIPLNPTPGYLVMGSPRSSVDRFVRNLRDRGVNTTVRDTRGVDIDAACGQLASRHSKATPVMLQTPAANKAD